MNLARQFLSRKEAKEQSVKGAKPGLRLIFFESLRETDSIGPAQTFHG